MKPTVLEPSELVRDSWGVLCLSDRLPTAQWFREYYYTHDGRPFDEFTVPWVTAPGGPCEAADDPQYRFIWLQWAARMFKTSFGQGVQMMHADRDPCPMMFATVDETLCKGIFGRFWKMAEHSPALRHRIPPERLRSRTHMRFDSCEVYGAWVRGASRLADKSVRVGHGNEIDKWEHETTSTEGDPLPRFIKRGDEFADAKFILESTPSERRRSRVEAGRLRSTNHRYCVPCPHCAKFAPLVKGDGVEPPGLFWERDANGKNDPDLARKTCRYVCGYCKRDILDVHRPEMMNRGVWVPEGCEVDHDRAMRARELGPHDKSWLRGDPTRQGRDYGSQISSLYGLFQGWGDFAAGFLNAKQRNQQTLRQFINEDMAETWEPAERRETWEQIGTRIIEPEIPRGVVPDGFSFVTMGCDKQKEHYVYVVAAWGPGLRCHVLDYGTPEDETDLLTVCKEAWSHIDGGDRLKTKAALLDSGFHPRDVAQMVRRFRAQSVPLWLCRGSSTKLEGVFKIAQQGKRSYMPGLTVVWVDSSSTQDWMDGAISAKDEEKPLSLFAGSLFEHEDFIAQILNDAEVEKLDARNNATVGWNRINENVPNDYRDAMRYAYAAAVMLTRCGDAPQRQSAKPKSARSRPAPAHLLQRPGGWVQGMRR